MAYLETTNERREVHGALADEEVLARSLREPRLFGVLVERYERPFLARARHVVGDREEVYDIVQDVFTKIYLNAHRFEKQEGASFKSWAYKILMNTSFTYYQKFKKERAATVHLEREALENMELFSEDIKVRDSRMNEFLLLTLSRMPRRLCRVLRMYFFEGRPQKEIAEKENISVGAVKTRVYRAKKEFRRLILEANPAFEYDDK